MRMSKAIKVEKERLEKIFSQILNKLNLDLNIVYQPMSPYKIKKQPHIYFYIERSYRDKEDKNTFLVTFNPALLPTVTLSKMKRHAFHEILHALTWPFTDEYSEVIKYIKDIKLHNELTERHLHTRENIVYTFERKLGPLILTDADWSSED